MMTPPRLTKAAARSSKTTLPHMLELARALGRIAARLDEAEERQGHVTLSSLTQPAQGPEEVSE